jgi:hypothetical protein
MCLFPLTFISRRPAAWLYARRVQAGFALRRPGAPQWPFCESFAATEAARSGLEIADIRRFLPEPQDASPYDAVSWSEIPQRSEKLIHPVLSGDPFVNKVIVTRRRCIPKTKQPNPSGFTIVSAACPKAPINSCSAPSSRDCSAARVARYGR